jgi:hypothetical protein
MRESDPARKSTFDLLLGKRTMGRPKRRWIDDEERELKGMGLRIGKDWRWKGINGRKLWRRTRPKLGCRSEESEGERDNLFPHPRGTSRTLFWRTLLRTCSWKLGSRISDELPSAVNEIFVFPFSSSSNSPRQFLANPHITWHQYLLVIPFEGK